ncbi:hypothetical protein [Lederbergia lenta]|nr:hypothetical protein [Lederbergia lenta]
MGVLSVDAEGRTYRVIIFPTDGVELTLNLKINKKMNSRKV